MSENEFMNYDSPDLYFALVRQMFPFIWLWEVRKRTTHPAFGDYMIFAGMEFTERSAEKQALHALRVARSGGRDLKKSKWRKVEE